MIVEFSVEDGLGADWDRWDRQRITALVCAIIAGERPDQPNWVISLHMVSDATIRALNAQHRARDAPTDVLSFPLAEPEFVLPPDEPVHLGDIVISYPRAVEQAADFGHPVEREIAYLVAHGVLHVLGYDHEIEAERKVMRQKEEEALQPLGFTR